MFEVFYKFHNKPLAWNLFNRDTEDGTPLPPISKIRITEDGIIRITETGIEVRITE